MLTRGKNKTKTKRKN